MPAGLGRNGRAKRRQVDGIGADHGNAGFDQKPQTLRILGFRQRSLCRFAVACRREESAAQIRG